MLQAFGDIRKRILREVKVEYMSKYILHISVERTSRHSSSVAVAIMLVDRFLCFVVSLCFFVASCCLSSWFGWRNTVLRGSVVTSQEDPGLVLSSPSIVAAAAAAAVPVVVVFVIGFVSLLASPVTRLEVGSLLVDVVASSSSTACLLFSLRVFGLQSMFDRAHNQHGIRKMQ